MKIRRKLIINWSALMKFLWFTVLVVIFYELVKDIVECFLLT